MTHPARSHGALYGAMLVPRITGHVRGCVGRRSGFSFETGVIGSGSGAAMAAGATKQNLPP